jgi:hypothetical protein
MIHLSSTDTEEQSGYDSKIISPYPKKKKGTTNSHIPEKEGNTTKGFDKGVYNV